MIRVVKVTTLGRAELAAASKLLAAVGMRRREVGALRKAIANSDAVVVARDGDELVGFGRLISDGVYYGSLWDIAVAPDRQGRGIGRLLVERLLSIAKTRRYYMTGLFTASHNFEFYEKHGFAVVRDVHAMTRPSRSKRRA